MACGEPQWYYDMINTHATNGLYYYVGVGKVYDSQPPAVQLPETLKIRCGYCGRKVSDAEPLCQSCGAPLPFEWEI